MNRRQILQWASGSLLTPAGWAFAAGARQRTPRATLDAAEQDLGVVALGSDPAVTFAIRNVGAAPLTLVVGRVPVGLRLATADATIAPESTGYVRLTLETFRAGATQAWRVPVTTNDPEQPELQLVVRADVRTFVLVTPPSARFTYVQHEREGGTTHLVGAAGHPDFRITRVESPYPFLDATFEAATDAARPDGAEGPLWRVSLTIRKTAAVGPLGANVVLHTNHPKQPRAWLPVSGFVRPLLGVTPPEVSLPTWSAGSGAAPPTQTLLVTNFGEEPLDITVREPNIGGVITDVVPVQAGRRWRVVVRANGNAAAAQAKGALAIATSRSDVPDTIVAFTRK